MEKTLVTYYTKTGSTLDVAERIQQQLNSAGIPTDLMKFEDVTSIRQYGTVIIGAPINGFKWVPQADSFLKEYNAELHQKQLAAFCLSYLNQYPRPMFKNMIRRNFEKSIEPFSPIKTEVFGGLGGTGFPTPIRLLFGVPKNMPKDTRNWQTVDEFSERMIQYLKK